MLHLRSAVLALTVLSGLALGCATQHGTEPASRAVPPSPPTATATRFEPGGIGTLEARGPRGDTSNVTLTRVHILARQQGDMAEIEATHHFYNDSDVTLEGTFRFPMPDGAILTGLAMMIDGKLMEGELVERDKARRVYEEIVDNMQDPALLEWEHGSVFKMRVFPIAARETKVVTLRYLAPLRRQRDQLELVQAARSVTGDARLPALRIDFGGKTVFDERDVAPGRELAFPARPASAVLRESRPDGNFAVVRVSPDWRKIPVKPKPAAKNWFVVVDTSRSALEERARQLEALEAALGALPAGARFQVLVSDLETRASPQGWAGVNTSTVASAVAFVKSVAPDGASDLGRALRVVGELAHSEPDSALLYLGDCEPTWGTTDEKALLDQQRRDLPSTPFHALMLGASVNEDLAAELSRQSGGRHARVRRREDLEAFTRSLAQGVISLADLRLHAGPDTEVLLGGPLSIEPGSELQLLLRAPAGRDPLAGLSLKASVGGGFIDLLPRAPVEASDGVARRFGAGWVKKLERANAPAAELVSASLSYGVMSKLTSFLVLESEEAYARYAIARKQAGAADGPRVTGANLESSAGTEISADRVQPGDPEIYVEAERDALSVTVEFPFGETKTATFDPEARGGHGAWMVRFLVARDTPEGDYEALARITHRDGTVEVRKVRYTVDNTAPELDVKLTPHARRRGLVEVTVTQPGAGPLSDLKRVELRAPAGTTYRLTAVRWGTFRALIPQQELRGGKLRVVGFDQALNHAVKELDLP